MLCCWGWTLQFKLTLPIKTQTLVNLSFTLQGRKEITSRTVIIFSRFSFKIGRKFCFSGTSWDQSYKLESYKEIWVQECSWSWSRNVPAVLRDSDQTNSQDSILRVFAFSYAATAFQNMGTNYGKKRKYICYQLKWQKSLAIKLVSWDWRTCCDCCY